MMTKVWWYTNYCTIHLWWQQSYDTLTTVLYIYDENSVMIHQLQY